MKFINFIIFFYSCIMLYYLFKEFERIDGDECMYI